MYQFIKILLALIMQFIFLYSLEKLVWRPLIFLTESTSFHNSHKLVASKLIKSSQSVHNHEFDQLCDQVQCIKQIFRLSNIILSAVLMQMYKFGKFMYGEISGVLGIVTLSLNVFISHESISQSQQMCILMVKIKI